MTEQQTDQSVEIQNVGITIVRTFAATPEQVFAAWTTPAAFANWFGGTAATVPLDSVSMDVRPGGAWSATMLVQGGQIPWRGHYQEVDPPARLSFTLADRPGDEYELVTVELAAVEGGTEMTFTQAGGHMDAAGYAQARAGWLVFFDAMAAGLTRPA